MHNDDNINKYTTIGTGIGNGTGEPINTNKKRPIIQQTTHNADPEVGTSPLFITFAAINDDNIQDDNKTNAPGGVAIKFILDYINNDIKKYSYII